MMEKRKEGDLFLRGDFSSLLFTAHNAQLLLFIIIMAPTTAQKLLAAYNGFYGRTTTTTTTSSSFFFTHQCYNCILLSTFGTRRIASNYICNTSNSCALLSTTTQNETGVTLYHNWVTYYGPKGIMPYFLKTEGPVALVRSRW